MTSIAASASTSRVAASARSTVQCRAAAPPAEQRQVHRRVVLGGALCGMLSGAAIATPSPAHAFGKGFPGYDINIEAQKRAQGRNMAEFERERQKALEVKAARRAAREAAEREQAAQQAATKQ